MNNKKWVHRVAFGDIFYNVGPYAYIQHKLYEKHGLKKEDVEPLNKVMVAKERWAGSKFEFGMNKRLETIPGFQQYGCFSTFKARRPGPWDDPLLKQNLRSRNITRLKIHSVRATLKWDCFGFDSEQQMNAWFDDEEENKLLKDFGFRVHSRKVPAECVIPGLRQVWVMMMKGSH